MYIIYYTHILASFKLDIWTPWGCQRHPKTCRSSDSLYRCDVICTFASL